MTNLKVEYITLCDYATTSREGKLSIIGIFDRMFIRQTPSTFARFFLVAILMGEPDSENTLKLAIKDSQGKDILPPREIKIKLSHHGRSNIITDIVNLPLRSIGEHTITISSEDNVLSSHIFHVTQIKVPSQDQKLTLPN